MSDIRSFEECTVYEEDFGTVTAAVWFTPPELLGEDPDDPLIYHWDVRDQVTGVSLNGPVLDPDEAQRLSRAAASELQAFIKRMKIRSLNEIAGDA